MKTALFLILLAIFPANGQPRTADALLTDAINKVASLDTVADLSNGTLKLSVDFKSDILGRKASGSAKYLIAVKDGRDNANNLIGRWSSNDSTIVSMVGRELNKRLNKPIMSLYRETAFPWTRFKGRSDRRYDFRATIDSDSALVSGRRCFLISFTIDAENDSISADGEGKIWIDTTTLLPVRTYRDFEMNTPRGKAEVKSYSDFTRLENGLPVMLRSETQTIPKFLFLSVGSVKTIIEQSDFNLE